MNNKISRKKIVNALNLAGDEFRWCFGLVASLHGSLDYKHNGEKIIGFQIRLFRAIESLEEVYRQIIKEEKGLIKKKIRVRRVWW